MSPDLNLLVPRFREKVMEVISFCKDRGIEMRPYCTVRDPYEQARLWRQARTTEEISAAITLLKDKGADFLAHCIETAGPQYGRHATNALPGFSWHQWGQAVDCMWVVDGKAEWSIKRKINGLNGYRFYTDAAACLGLNPGGAWKRFKDWPHIQMSPASSPAITMGITEINGEMKRLF